MNANKKLIAIVAVALLFFIALGLFFWLSKDETGKSPISNLLPFGIGQDNNEPGPIAPPNNPSQAVTNVESQGNLPGLQRISDGPISGSILLTVGSSTIVRYADKATGNIFDFNTATKARVRISNTTIPQVQGVVWGSNGNSFLFQSTQKGIVQNYFAKLATSTGETSEVIGRYLDDSITSFTFSPKKDSSFFLSKTPFGIDGYLANRDGAQAKKIWSFRTREWLPSWTTGDSVYLTTKSSARAGGFMYALNTKTGAFTPLLSNIPGFSTLAGPAGESILYSKTEGSKFLLYLYVEKDKSSQIVPYPTFPEKCVWSTVRVLICGVPRESLGANALDDWYKGLVSYNDFVQIVSIGTEISNIFSGPEATELKDQNGLGMDVTNPTVSSDGTLFVFENKKDMSLWILPISNGQ